MKTSKTDKVLSVIEKFEARLCQRELSGRDISTADCRKFINKLRGIVEVR